MDNLDNKTPLQAGDNDLQAQCDALRHLITSVLILVIVVSGTLNIYLLRQWKTTSKDLAAIRPQAEQMISEYTQKSGPLMNDFFNKITEYGRTHPDFAPILAKYNIKPVAAAGVPAAAPRASAPAAKPKK
jgi:hypothetical protein